MAASIDGAVRQGRLNKTKKDGTVIRNGTCLMNGTNDSELYSFYADGSQMLFCDSSEQFISTSTNAATLVAMFARDFVDDC